MITTGLIRPEEGSSEPKKSDDTPEVTIVVLAAGKSSRFGTGENKQIIEVCEKPMIEYVLEPLHELNWPISVVVGHQKELVEARIKAFVGGDKITFCVQDVINGTGSAVYASRATWTGTHVLVLNGDMPLINSDLIQQLYALHTESSAVMSFCVTTKFNPSGYGRMVKNSAGRPIIREERDCSIAEKEINSVNAGVYLFRRDFLSSALVDLMTPSADRPKKAEFYITDLVNIASNSGARVATLEVPEIFVTGVNTFDELSTVEEVLYTRAYRKLMAGGVRMHLPKSSMVGPFAQIGKGTVIECGVKISGHSVIGENCRISVGAILDNVTLGDGVTILPYSVLSECSFGAGSVVGPFAHIRPGVAAGERVAIGNFVEVKKSRIGTGTKAKHLSYIGDATLGESVNIGAGMITCNYDGVSKHETVIEDHVMVGANTSIVAPCTLGARSTIGAGSVITKDVPADALAVERGEQRIVEGWRLRKKSE